MNLINERVATDQETLSKLNDAGDDEQIVRLIDHSFVAPQESPLAALAECLQMMEFSDIEVFQPEEEDYFLLECTSIDCTEFHNIVKTSVLMEMLAETFEVEYDGWGCSVVTAEQLE